MKKHVRYLVFFFVVTLLFLCVSVTCAAKDNDAKFDSYINMGDNAVKMGYEIPNLLRQNGVYSNIRQFPLVVQGGVEYVPLSVFILYPYIDVNYGRTESSFFLVNNKNNHYVSFNTSEGVASTHDGDILKMPTPIFNYTTYVPARTVAVVLGLECETYDNPSKGIYAFRVSDGKTGKTLSEMMAEYIMEYENKTGLSNNQPPSGNDNPAVDVRPPEVQDPISQTAARRVGICFAGMSYTGMTRITDMLDSYNIKAAFSFTEEEILTMPEFVRKLGNSGNSIFITASASGGTAEEYARSFVEGLDMANKALKLVSKKKTRMCTLPFDMPESIKNDEAFLAYVKGAGYLVFMPNSETGDGPSYTGSAYTVSSKIKDKITNGFDKDVAAEVTALVYCSDKTYYYILDVAQFVGKYGQFEFFAMDEAFLYNN